MDSPARPRDIADDIDTTETQEWVSSLEAVLENEGPERDAGEEGPPGLEALGPEGEGDDPRRRAAVKRPPTGAALRSTQGRPCPPCSSALAAAGARAAVHGRRAERTLAIRVL